MTVQSLSSSNWVLTLNGSPASFIPGSSVELPVGFTLNLGGFEYADTETNSWVVVLGDGAFHTSQVVSPTGEYWSGFVLGMAVVGVAASIAVVRRALRAGDVTD